MSWILLLSCIAVSIGNPSVDRFVAGSSLLFEADPGAAPPTSQDPPAEPTPEDGTAVLRFFESRYREARTAFAEGNFRAAWQISEAILILAPDVPFHDDLRRLRRDAQGRFLARSVIIVAFEPADDLSFPLTELRGHVTIENHSMDPITIGSDEKEPVLGLAHFRLNTLGVNSLGESVQEGTRVVRMPKEFRIGIGEVHRFPISIPIPPGGEEVLIQRWMLRGALRPIAVRLGKEEFTRGVPWVENHGVLLPDDLADVAGAPLAHVRRALLTGDRRRFAAASTLWWAEVEEDGKERTLGVRERMVEELLAALGRFDGELDRHVIRFLETLTGELRERTVRSWQIWGLTRVEHAPGGDR